MKQIGKPEKMRLKLCGLQITENCINIFLIPSFILLLFVIVLESTYLRKLPFIASIANPVAGTVFFYVVLKKEKQPWIS
jgi:hypothetical protein